MAAAGAGPTVALLLPCHDEATYLPELLAALVPQASAGGWQVVAVDDTSTDGTGSILDDALGRYGGAALRVAHGSFGSPGAARATAAAMVTVLAHERAPDWLVTIDADVEVPPDFVARWSHAIAVVHHDERVGALNGGEEQVHLLAGLPNAARASAAFGRAAARAEAAVGIANLNGVNHAVRTAAYLTAGPYRQPTITGPGGVVNLAGEDWDLGVRLRLAGFEIAQASVAVRDRGRRLLADVHAYLSGHAYEGAFTRVHASGEPADLDAQTADAVADATVDRVLVHFFFKIVLACPSLLDRDLGLAPATADAMRAWMARWPSPAFADSRDGFVYGRLPRFAAAFGADVRRQLGLTDPHQEH